LFTAAAAVAAADVTGGLSCVCFPGIPRAFHTYAAVCTPTPCTQAQPDNRMEGKLDAACNVGKKSNDAAKPQCRMCTTSALLKTEKKALLADASMK